MESQKPPNCGHETVPDAACPACAHADINGVAKPARRDPPPPPELAGVVFERPTPEMIEEARRTFDEAEYLAGVREIEAGRGVTFEEIMAEIERKIHGRN